MDFQTYAARELTTVADKLAEVAKKQLDAATAQLTANYEATIDRLRNDQAQLVNENERLTAENAALLWEKEELTEKMQSVNRGRLIDQLTETFARIAASQTTNDVLTAVVDGLASDFKAVAVYAGSQLVGHVGSAVDPNTPSASAFPIVVRGEPLATLFAADELRAPEGARLGSVLCRHAALALDRLTLELKAIGELRAYAQMLLDEVEYVFNADTTANVAATERRDRLTENLRCARQIYGQRVTLEGPAAASLLDEVLSQILDAKADSAFGRELADVATAPATAA